MKMQSCVLKKYKASDLQEHMRDIEQYSRENSIVHRLCTECNTPVPRWYGQDYTHLLPYFINTPSCLVVIWNSSTPWISFANWTNKLTLYFALFIPVLLQNCSLMIPVHLDDHILGAVLIIIYVKEKCVVWTCRPYIIRQNYKKLITLAKTLTERELIDTFD